MRILVFIDDFHHGGAARVTSTMLSGLAEQGHEVILALDNKNRGVFYPIDSRVKVLSFGAKKIRIPILNLLLKEAYLILQSRKIIASVEPDIVIAVTYMVFSQVYIGSRFMNVPVVAYDHTTFTAESNYLRSFVVKYLYKRADKLIVLTNKDKRFLESQNYKNICVLYNPMSFDLLESHVNRDKIVLCVGRLDDWNIKGLDIIIEIWSRMANIYPDWMLEIAGDGSERSISYLLTLIKQYNISSRVNLLGQIKNIKEKYRRSSVFVLPSRIEGFPMSLMEALSQGCACLSFSINHAVDEMIVDGATGIIVEDGNIDEFAEKLSVLIENEKKRERLSSNAINDIRRFRVSEYMKSLEIILESVMKDRVN